MVDLISDVMRTRKTENFQFMEAGSSFLKIIADINLPESFVKNKYRITQFRSYKRNADGDIDEDDDDYDNTLYRRSQVAKARKQLEASGSRRSMEQNVFAPPLTNGTLYKDNFGGEFNN